MKIKVRIPLSFHKLTGNKTEFECQGNTVEELLNNMENQYPGIREILWDKEGQINSSLSLFLNGSIVRFCKSESILLKEGDEILIMQLVAGG
jgi:molybdopterin synthase sulfur carrier subunit